MFGTSGIRGPVGETVTAALALSVGRSLGTEGYDRVVVGRDVRESGAALVDALSAGLVECGATVFDAGVASTPTVARGVGWLDADAGVVVTASHNPPQDNGIKLWGPTGRAFDGDEQAAVVSHLEAGTFDLAAWDGIGVRRQARDLEERHVSAICAAVAPEGRPSVVVDIGNGCGGLTATALEQLGCRVRTLHAQRDGSFPGRPSEPTEATLGDLEILVRETDADLGVAHDGDADRMLAVDDRGRFVPKDVLLSLFGRTTVMDGDRVAVPVDTSMAVDDALDAVGATTTRTPVGDVYVAERATEPDVSFGGEPSGAWIWPDETLCPDGPLAACKLVELVSRRGPLSELVETVDRYPIRRDSIEVTDRDAVMEAVETAVRETHGELSTLDGLRVEREDGWFLIRPSGTEPLVRITAEAREESAVEELIAEVRDLVQQSVELSDGARE